MCLGRCDVRTGSDAVSKGPLPKMQFVIGGANAATTIAFGIASLSDNAARAEVLHLLTRYQAA